MAERLKDGTIVVEWVSKDSKKQPIGVHGPGSNVNVGHQDNKGGNGGKSSKGGNAGQGGPGNGNNNITYHSKKGANVPKDSKKQPIANNKGDASGVHGLGSTVNFGPQTNQGGNGGNSFNGGNAGQGGPGNGNNNITYC